MLGIHLKKPILVKESMDDKIDHLSYGSSTMQGWRSDQQDSHNTILNYDENTSFFAVYDGHCGAEIAQYCSKYLPDFLKNSKRYKKGEKLEEALSDSFIRFDESLLRKKKELSCHDCGCTAVVALIREKKYLYVANAGDSRCVVCRDGQAIEMSFDHKPENVIEKERISKAGGYIKRNYVYLSNEKNITNIGLNLSRSIGDHRFKKNKNVNKQIITSLPEVKLLNVDLNRDKFMVLACDGIWECMSSQEVCDFITERLNYLKLSLICEELLDHCLAPKCEGFGCDNMTCIIIKFL